MKSPKISMKQARIHGASLLFLLPAFALFAFVVILPFLQGVPYSSASWKSVINTDCGYVGFSNYITLIKDRYFQQAFLHTFQFTAIYVAGASVLGLSPAPLLNGSKWYTNIARIVVFIPSTVTLTSGVIIWSYVYTDIISPLFSIVNPLGVSGQVIPAVAVITIWRDMGYCMMIYIAALQSIPDDYYDAAKTDGTNRWQKVKGITFPLIVPAIISNVTLLVVWGLKCFDYPVTVAGNTEAARTAAMYVYNNIFGFDKTGLGRTAAVIITVVLMILTYAITAVCNRLEMGE